MSWIFSSIPATSMKGRFTFHFLFPDIIQTKSLLEVSKGKVEIREPLSSSSMEGWAPALLPVSDASIDKARGKMATVHPGACILKLLQPAAFRWALTAKKNSVSAGPLVFFSWFSKQYNNNVLWWLLSQINTMSLKTSQRSLNPNFW